MRVKPTEQEAAFWSHRTETVRQAERLQQTLKDRGLIAARLGHELWGLGEETNQARAIIEAATSTQVRTQHVTKLLRA